MVGDRAIGAWDVAASSGLLPHAGVPLVPQNGFPVPSVDTHASPDGDLGHASLAIARCHVLLSERGEVSGAKLAATAIAAYRALDAPAIARFFDLLLAECSSDADGARRSADRYCADPSLANLTRLQHSTDTPRSELFRRLNLTPGGTCALIEMRARVLRGLDDHPAWAVIDAELDQLLRSWFNHGFLVCRRIDAASSPAILERLVQYEAVHRIRDRRDLLRRLESDRRCYGLFHPALPDDPVIFAELSLTRELSARVQPLLDPLAPVLDPASCTFALFYSISSCHEGLRGFSFGNSLIRHIVEELQGELPRLKGFATLSPIPGFRRWLAGLADPGEGDRAHLEMVALLARLDAPDWLEDRARRAALERELVPLCAYYLLRAKHGTEPADPVARFHLANGARLERINWLGDTSAAGMRRSAGMTVNYVYGLADLERNHEAYSREGRINTTRRIDSLSREASIDARLLQTRSLAPD
jgi:malonyl-CoA decarboxylase